MNVMATAAANRFGLGARSGEIARIESDPRGAADGAGLSAGYVILGSTALTPSHRG